MGYDVTSLAEVSVTDLSEVEEIPPDLELQAVGGTLGCENLKANVWHFEEGDEISYHAHETQEELFYVIDGKFSLKLGPSGDTEFVEVEKGAFWLAKPMVGRGHRCISDDGGTVLAIGAPNVEDPGLDPHAIDEDEIE